MSKIEGSPDGWELVKIDRMVIGCKQTINECNNCKSESTATKSGWTRQVHF